MVSQGYHSCGFFIILWFFDRSMRNFQKCGKITSYLLNNYIGVKSSNCHKPFIIKGINNNNNLKHYFKEQQKNVKK